MLKLAQALPAPVTVSLEKRQSSPFRPRAILPRRLRGHIFGLLFLATVAFFFHYNHSSTSTSNADDPDGLLSYLRGLPKPEGGSKPPRFYEWHDREKRLPQHNVNLPYPQGREGRYIRFTNQICGTSSFLFFRGCGAVAISRYESDRPIIGTKASAGAMLCKRCCSTLILHIFPSERRYTPVYLCLVIYSFCVGTCLRTTLGTGHPGIFQNLLTT